MLIDSSTAAIGWQAAPFQLSDPSGKQFSFDQLMGVNGLLVAFICNHCPYVKAIVSRLVDDARALQDQDIGVVAINSNDFQSVPEDRPERMEVFAMHHGFTFPYLVDVEQSVAQAFGAVCTPDFFGLDANRKLQYRGRLDDAKMGEPGNRAPELVEAMLQIKEIGSGPKVQHASMGCSIKWKR